MENSAILKIASRLCIYATKTVDLKTVLLSSPCATNKQNEKDSFFRSFVCCEVERERRKKENSVRSGAPTMSSAEDLLQKYNGGDFIVLERELRRLPRSSLTLPDGPSGMRLLEPLVVALHNVRSSAGVVALNILGILACDPDNRDALLNATEFQGESLENVWGESVGGARGDAKGEDEVADGGDRNGFDDLDADDRIRAALLVLLYRLANYHLDPQDILALTSGASVTGSSDSAGAGGDGDDMNHVHIGVASVVGALGRLLRTPDLEPPLQAAAVTTLGKLALPDTYHRSTFEDNQGPITSTNDVAISKSRVHVTGVSISSG